MTTTIITREQKSCSFYRSTKKTADPSAVLFDIKTGDVCKKKHMLRQKRAELNTEEQDNDHLSKTGRTVCHISIIYYAWKHL